MIEDNLVPALDVATDWLMVLEGRKVLYASPSLLRTLEQSQEQVHGHDAIEVLPFVECSELEVLLEHMQSEDGDSFTGDIECEDPIKGPSRVFVNSESREGYTYLSLSGPGISTPTSDDHVMALEDRLAAILSLTASARIGMGVFEVGSDGIPRVKSVNEHILDILGKSESEVIGKSPLELVHPDDVAIAQAAIGELMNGSTTSTPITLRMIDGEGENAYVQITNTLLSSTDRVLALSFLQDQTPMHDALDMQNRMAQAIDRVDDTVVLADHMGNIIYANPASLRNSGYTFEEVIGQPVSIFHAPEALEAIGFKALEELMTKGWFRNDVMACTKDGKRYPVEVVSSLVRDENDEVSMIVVVSRKIGERQQFEAQLLMSKASNEYIIELLSDELCPQLEGSVTTLNTLVEADETDSVPKDQLAPVLKTLKSILGRSKMEMANIPPTEDYGVLHPTPLAKVLSERVPKIVELLRARGNRLDVNLNIEDEEVTVMANMMLTELISRVLSLISDIMEEGKRALDVTLRVVPLTARPDYPGDVACEVDEPCFAEVSFTGPGLRVGEDINMVLTRREAPSRDALSSRQSFAIETARLLVFFYKGEFYVEKVDPNDPKSVDRLVIILPIEGSDLPAQQAPFTKIWGGRD
jgi:PAS domain S-box-containing protein